MIVSPKEILGCIAITVVIVLYIAISIIRHHDKIDFPRLSIFSVITFSILFGCCFILDGGCKKRNKNINNTSKTKIEKNYVSVHLVSSGQVVQIPKNEFIGKDSIFIKLADYEDIGLFIYQNDTKKDLMTYSLKYTKNGVGSNDKVIGSPIYPNEYFTWEPSNKNYYMFKKPPSSTSIVTYHKQYQIDAVYLYFLDYADCVPCYISKENYKPSKSKKNK